MKQKVSENKATGAPIAELFSRQKAAELKLKKLTEEANNGKLDPVIYLQSLKDKVLVEKKLAAKLSKEVFLGDRYH